MSIVTLFSASFAGGESVAAQVAAGLGYATLTDAELYAAAAKTFPLDAERYSRALYDPPTFFNRVTREKEKGVAHLRLAMVEALVRDNLVYHGYAMHLVPSTLTHVLRVGLPAKWEHRLRRATTEQGWSEREAEKRLRKQDEVAAAWVYDLFGMSPWDERLYDVVLPLGEGAEADAVATLVAHLGRPALATTKLARAAVEDAILAARVNIALVEKGHDVDVSCVDGEATILIREYSMRLEKHQRELVGIASAVPGVSKATARPGPRYQTPGIYADLDEDLPRKVLLVDDEQEFVQTLSERLQTRDFETSIAYNGEEALTRVDADEPEVIVLDLKMPGIDGIEVLRRVKRDHPGTEVIILTGHGSAKEERLAEELGAFAYLRKPVDIDVLTETMQAAYRKIRAGREPDDSAAKVPDASPDGEGPAA